MSELKNESDDVQAGSACSPEELEQRSLERLRNMTLAEFRADRELHALVVRLSERSACAKICEDYALTVRQHHTRNASTKDILLEAARRIRTQG